MSEAAKSKLYIVDKKLYLLFVLRIPISWDSVSGTMSLGMESLIRTTNSFLSNMSPTTTDSLVVESYWQLYMPV